MARPRFSPRALRLAERLSAEPEKATADEVGRLADAVWIHNSQLQSESQAKNGGYHPMDESRARGYLAYKQFCVSGLSTDSEREALQGVLILNHDGPSKVLIPITREPDGLGFATDVLHDIFDRSQRVVI